MKLRVEKAVYGGAGLAHRTDGPESGRTVFVSFVLPEELVEATLTGTKDGFDEATLLEVLEQSSDRISPKCMHFGACGGCQYQHANYPTQIRTKSDILRETLSRAGIDSLPEIAIHSASPWEYRNRVRFRTEKIEGRVQIGYNRRGTNEFLPIRECPILSPLLWKAAEAIIRIGEESSKAARLLQETLEVELFTDADQKKLQATVFARKTQPGFTEFCEHLQKLVPELIGVGVSVMPDQRKQRRSQKPQTVESWGVDGISYRVADESYWVSRNGFFQVNRLLLDELVKIVTEGRAGSLAWDLYAGVGLFSRQLAHAFTHVVAVEVAGNDLSKSFKGPGRSAVETTTVEFLRGAVVQRERPELIVMDPPRAGVGAEVCTLLNRVSAKEMVYVSCDPVTLARDLKILIAAGYQLTELHMIDLFPQTFHLETVVVLRK